MAQLEQRPTIEIQINFRLSESEARALEALAGYGDKVFLEVFYKHLGKTYLEPHEAGLRSLLTSVRQQLPPILHRANDARIVFVRGLKVIEKEIT